MPEFKHKLQLNPAEFSGSGSAVFFLLATTVWWDRAYEMPFAIPNKTPQYNRPVPSQLIESANKVNCVMTFTRRQFSVVSQLSNIVICPFATCRLRQWACQHCPSPRQTPSPRPTVGWSLPAQRATHGWSCLRSHWCRSSNPASRCEHGSLWWNCNVFTGSQSRANMKKLHISTHFVG